MAFDLGQLQEMLQNAENADAVKKELSRSLGKIENILVTLNTAVQEAQELLSANYTPKARAARGSKVKAEKGPVDPAAPFGRKKDGTPMKRRGKVKAGEEAAPAE